MPSCRRASAGWPSQTGAARRRATTTGVAGKHPAGSIAAVSRREANDEQCSRPGPDAPNTPAQQIPFASRATWCMVRSRRARAVLIGGQPGEGHGEGADRFVGSSGRRRSKRSALPAASALFEQDRQSVVLLGPHARVPTSFAPSRPRRQAGPSAAAVIGPNPIRLPPVGAQCVLSHERGPHRNAPATRRSPPQPGGLTSARPVPGSVQGRTAAGLDPGDCRLNGGPGP